MRAAVFLPVLAGAVLAAASPAAAAAADPTTAELVREVQRLSQRLEELERSKAQLDKSLAEPTISADEPELTARLKAAESDVLSYKQGSKTIDVLGGIKVGAGMTVVGQNLVGQQLDKEGQLNWRGDVTLTIPGGAVGTAKGTIYTHLRMGQGRGLQSVNNSYSSPNATAFQRPGADNSDAAIDLVQAWYQLDVPIGGTEKTAKSRVEITAGKMDPFGFFDQNALASDETRSFMNQALVHNPLLDAGGDVGVDALGFTPGLRVAYVNEAEKSTTWRLQGGIFETGDGAAFQNSTDFPFRILQAETTQRFFGGLEGNYRVYGWQNTRAANFDGLRAAHMGLGFSLDQKIHDYTTLFARYGHQIKGNPRFDQSLTFGGELGGSYWGRGADGLGLAFGLSHTSAAFRSKSEGVDADNDGTPDFGYRAQAYEQLAELYYRYRVMPRFDLTPDFQLVRHPGGDPSNAVVYALALRGQLTY
ncbi:MAG: carbohydrate porin [Phaeospirillum sp.]|nr:carbohydrate porin [Phaeospirillum sp.]